MSRSISATRQGASNDERVCSHRATDFSRNSTWEQQSQANLRRGGEANVLYGQIDGRITLVGTSFDSDIEGPDKTPAFSGEGERGSSGACSVDRNPSRCEQTDAGSPRYRKGRPMFFQACRIRRGGRCL